MKRLTYRSISRRSAEEILDQDVHSVPHRQIISEPCYLQPGTPFEPAEYQKTAHSPALVDTGSVAVMVYTATAAAAAAVGYVD